MFRGYYVVSSDESSSDGYKFHYWAETVEECREWIMEKEIDRYPKSSQQKNPSY